jgi:uncharacterized protein YkwD
VRRILAAALVALGSAALIDVPVDAGTVCWNYRVAERKLARKMNRARTAHDLARLKLDPELSRVSRKHTNEMVRRDDVFHTSSKKLTQRVTNWVVLGENIGRTTRGVRRIFRLMMDSAPHRANILYPAFTFVGVGTRREGGRLWVTITFESVANPGTTLSMPTC